jgi:hypothetical protein
MGFSTISRTCLMREFCVPIQGVYEPMLPESATDRYQLVVDGEYYSVRRAQQVTKEVSYAKLNEMRRSTSQGTSANASRVG